MRGAQHEPAASGVGLAPGDGLLMEGVMQGSKTKNIFLLAPRQHLLGQSQGAATMILM